MRVRLLRWLLGVPPAIVGGGWHGDAICLVRIDRNTEGRSQVDCAYEVLPAEWSSGVDSQGHVRANTLKSLLERWGNSPKRLALGIPAGDVFIKTIDVPLGLEERDLMQLAVVEAVANLPVPPEEVCADYLRMGSPVRSGQQQIKIAFCRREIIDDLALMAEDAGAQLAMIDRDIQAIHDAALWLIARHAPEVQVEYPLLLLWITDSPTLIVARDELDLVQYSLQITDLVEQIHASCRRAGLSDDAGLRDLWVFQTPGVDDNLVSLLAMRQGPVHWLVPEEILGVSTMPPLTLLVTALGMALRETA